MVGKQDVIKEGETPFYGGQSVGIPYHVTIEYNLVQGHGTRKRSASVYGPVIGINVRDRDTGGKSIGVLAGDGSAENNIKFYEIDVGNSLFNPFSIRKIISIVRTDGQPDTGGNPPPEGEVKTIGNYPKIRQSDITQLPDFSLPDGGIGFKPISRSGNGTGSKLISRAPTLIPSSIPQPKGKGKNTVDPNPSFTSKTLLDNETESDKPPFPEINRDLKNNEKWVYQDGKWLIKKTTKSKYNWNQFTKINTKVITNSPDLTSNPSLTNTTTPANKTNNNNDKFELEKLRGIPITIAPPPNRIPEDVEDKNPKPDYIQPPVVPPPPVQTKVDKCKGSCASKAAKNGVNLLDDNGNTINAANLFNDVILQNDLLEKIDQTTTFTKSLVSKAWKATGADKVLNTVSAIASLHNAAMLSQNAAQSIGDVATNAFSLFGIKDFDGNPIDVNSAIGGAISNKLTSIFGAANLDAASKAWLKLNRIHQAVSMTVYSIQGTKNALLEADEVTGGHIAKIGNALQEQGLIEDDTYDWMNPEPVYQQPFKGILGKIDAIEEMSDRVSSVVSTGLEIKENTTELVTSSQTLVDATKIFISTKNKEEATKQTESASPQIDRLDTFKYEAKEEQ